MVAALAGVGAVVAPAAAAAPGDGLIATYLIRPPATDPVNTWGNGPVSITPMQPVRTAPITLTGRLVTDQNVLSGALVTLRTDAGAVVAEAWTDATGTYTFKPVLKDFTSDFKVTYAGNSTIAPAEGDLTRFDALYKTRIAGVKVFKEKAKKKQPKVFMSGRIQRWVYGEWQTTGLTRMKDCRLIPEFRAKGKSTWQRKPPVNCTPDGRFSLPVARPLGSTKGHWRLWLIRTDNGQVQSQRHWASTSKAVYLNR
ncbi:carboxypeptidase-like regulatory domain-containing protein [Actinocorallia herbida]|uniref:carboxypeptidase-like regulatory domain-containing protein n=1 Tax=Actinocorallia herbida TaxID=58109 RepID=UPI0011CE9192|nr:carboxypeptidase-like regulatory domain-containing protein [Actinocorallia herbida]